MTAPSPKPYALKYWYKPGTVVRALIEAAQGHGVALVVGAVFGVVQAGPFYLVTERSKLSWLLVGAALGLFTVYLFAWLLRNFGRWFGAQAQLVEVRTALGLGLLPWTLLFAFCMPLLAGGAEAAAVMEHVYPLIFVGLIYGYVVLLLSLSAGLRLSALKTFLCLIVTFLVSLFPLALLSQMLFNAFSIAP